MTTRNWQYANEKVEFEEEGRCRVCRTKRGVERAHIIGRVHDAKRPLRWKPLGDPWEPYTVAPDRIVPLCGPPTDPKSCHGKAHARRLELLPHLTLHEQLQAVADAGGIESARIKLTPDSYPERRAA